MEESIMNICDRPITSGMSAAILLRKKDNTVEALTLLATNNQTGNRSLRFPGGTMSPREVQEQNFRATAFRELGEEIFLGDVAAHKLCKLCSTEKSTWFETNCESSHHGIHLKKFFYGELVDIRTPIRKHVIFDGNESLAVPQWMSLQDLLDHELVPEYHALAAMALWEQLVAIGKAA